MKRRTFLGLTTLAKPAILSAQSSARKVRVPVAGIDAIRDEAKLNAEIEEGHKSTLLCHLGNSVDRTGDAKKLWKREYRSGLEPTV